MAACCDNNVTAPHIALVYITASEMTYIVSGGALNSTHSLTSAYEKCV